MNPRISICVPNLNMLPFLPERFETIFAQTFQDWELFVYDSYSDDGAWEFLQSLASREPRMRIAQGPREGPYPAWNECLKQTKGEFVYIATSDDTMAPDCLEKLAAALDRNKDCDLAHCPLRVIGSAGEPKASPSWPHATVFANGLADMVNRFHIRKAPYDGLLHLTGRHVYLSISQLLIRRSLFSKTGLFSSEWGNISDFNWEMKAGLLTNTAHVPDTWASWRIHEKQVTVTQNHNSPERDNNNELMIQNAINSCKPHLAPKLLDSDWFKRTKNLRLYYSYLGHGRSVKDRRFHQAGKLIGGPPEIRSELMRLLFRKSKWPNYTPEDIRKWMDTNGLGPAISLDLHQDILGSEKRFQRDRAD